MALYKISASRVNNIEAQNYSGSVVEEGLIWYDPEQGILRLYNGNVGGYIINSSGGTPGGANTQVQFNNAGAFGGSANLTFDPATSTLGTAAVSATGNISAQYFVGNGSLLTGINTGPSTELINGTSNVRVYPSGPVAISVNGAANVAMFEGPQAQFDAVQVIGNITTNAYFIGNGSQLTGISANYANANVAAFLPTYTGNLVSLTGNVTTTANVTAQFFIGDGSQLTGISAQGLPSQNGNAGLYLSTDGSNVVWNGALGSSLTFSGGQSGSDEFGSDLNGGAANDNFIGSTVVLGGNASSDYNLTLSSVALTGQAEDVVISSPPLTANSAGSTGQVAFDPQYLYICISNNNWKRADLASW